MEMFTCMVYAYESEDLYTSLPVQNQLRKPVIRNLIKESTIRKWNYDCDVPQCNTNVLSSNASNTKQEIFIN